MNTKTKGTGANVKAKGKGRGNEYVPHYLVFNEDAFDELDDYIDGDGDMTTLDFFDFE